LVHGHSGARLRSATRWLSLRRPIAALLRRIPCGLRILTLKAIIAKIRPEPVRKPLPPLQHYEPPSKGRYRKRG